MGIKHQLAISGTAVLHNTDNSITVETVFKSMWSNPSREHGLRLTKFGFGLLSSALRMTNWKVELTMDSAKSGVFSSIDLIRLERHFSHPYYYTNENNKKYIYLFDENVAAMLILNGGDLARYLAEEDSRATRPVGVDRQV